MSTIKAMTPEEKKQHLHNVIMESKKFKAEAQAEFEKKCETLSYAKRLRFA